MICISGEKFGKQKGRKRINLLDLNNVGNSPKEHGIKMFPIPLKVIKIS
jgi:hypothetical protein